MNDDMEALAVECDRLAGERDDLQARIDAYEGRLEEWEEIDRLIAASSLGGEEAQRVRDSVPPQVGKLITRAMQATMRAEAAEAERDRLRAVVEDVRAGLPTRRFAELEAERDRLRAIVEGEALQLLSEEDQWRELIAERDRLREMWEEQRAIVKRLHESTLGQLTAERDRLQAVVDAQKAERPPGLVPAIDLLGEQVVVFLTRPPHDEQSIARGQLLKVADSGEVVVMDDMGFCHYAWPMLDIRRADQLDVSPSIGGARSTEGAPHESDGDGRFSSHGAPDPPNGGLTTPSTSAPHPTMGDDDD